MKSFKCFDACLIFMFNFLPFYRHKNSNKEVWNVYKIKKWQAEQIQKHLPWATFVVSSFSDCNKKPCHKRRKIESAKPNANRLKPIKPWQRNALRKRNNCRSDWINRPNHNGKQLIRKNIPKTIPACPTVCKGAFFLKHA